MSVCPSCNSENTQCFSMVFNSGVSTNHAAHVGMVGGRMAVAGSSGSSQSNLSKMCAPPRKSPVFQLLLLGIVAYIFVLLPITAVLANSMPDDSWAQVIFMCIFVLNLLGTPPLLALIAFRNWKFNRQVLPGLVSRWENSWLCHKCGNAYTCQ